MVSRSTLTELDGVFFAVAVVSLTDYIDISTAKLKD